ncbi:MAG TPA: hypothetical protein DEA77_05450 [Acinetobacter nosocomialis]|nr:hypothetical protein [Acinetobacter nosocomialis]
MTHLKPLLTNETIHAKNLLKTKIALHRTRLRVLDHKNFSVLFFYKPDRQPAPVLAVCRKTKTEKIEKNFSIFQFKGVFKYLSRSTTFRLIRKKLVLCEWGGFCPYCNKENKKPASLVASRALGHYSFFQKLKNILSLRA